jgi:hemolysin activation/secretion protein
VSVAVGAGTRLTAAESWASAGGAWVELVPIHPRHVLATRLRAGWSSSEVAHRLLTLGGADAVRSVEETAVLGNERLVANVEYRWSALRDISVPLPLAWVSELQLVPGFDAGAVWIDGSDAPSVASGATVGLYSVLDVFGARPTLVGAVMAFPISPVVSSVPQVYFSFDHAF